MVVSEGFAWRREGWESGSAPEWLPTQLSRRTWLSGDGGRQAGNIAISPRLPHGAPGTLNPEASGDGTAGFAIAGSSGKDANEVEFHACIPGLL